MRHTMKILLGLFGATAFSFSVALAHSPVALAIKNIPGFAISTRFGGLSLGTISLKPGSKGYFFDSSDTQMVALFQLLGIKSPRIGGASVDTNNSDYIPV